MKNLLKTSILITLGAIIGATVVFFFLKNPFLNNFNQKINIQNIEKSLSNIEKDNPAPVENSSFPIAKLTNEEETPAPEEIEKIANSNTVDCNAFDTNSFTSQMIELINEDRQKEGKKNLTWSSLLCESADLKADHMLENNYFEHNSPDGITPWSWIQQVGYKYTFSGENLALNYYSADKAHKALMDSPGHRENLMNENFENIGVSYQKGEIDAKPAFIVVQHFGSTTIKAPPPQYLCEMKKAEKNLKELKKNKKLIDEYLKNAEKSLKEFKDNNWDTEEIEDYIDEMEDKKKDAKKYIKEIEDYLEDCEEKGAIEKSEN